MTTAHFPEEGIAGPILFTEKPETCENGAVTLGWYGGWLVQIILMIYNDRLVLTPASNLNIYDYGWCFPKGLAHLAALCWNPDTEGEPRGYSKAVGQRKRLPGEKAA